MLRSVSMKIHMCPSTLDISRECTLHAYAFCSIDFHRHVDFYFMYHTRAMSHFNR